MSFSHNADLEFNQTDATKKIDQLRFIERQFGWKGDDWHFRLAQEMDEPIKVYAWFREAKKIGDRIYFNAKSKMGLMPFYWTKEHYIGHLLKAFGKVEICLASDGNILNSFNPYEKKERA
jgi:hypothetical protein